MWRALFLAIGITIFILGAECLGLERIVMKKRGKAPAVAEQTTLMPAAPAAAPRINIVPSDHMPWSLMATGLIVVIYSFTLPRRLKG